MQWVSIVIMCVYSGVNCVLQNEPIKTMEVTFKSPGLLKPRYLGPTSEKIILYHENRPDVFVSHDHGLTFTNKTDNFKIGAEYLNLDEIYTAPDGQQIIFTYKQNKSLFISIDFGATFTLKSLDFTPSIVSFYKDDSFLVFDRHNKVLYYTNTSKFDFIMIKQDVNEFAWQNGKNGTDQNLIIESSSSLYFLSGLDLDSFHSSDLKKIEIAGYKQFFVADEYLVALSSDNKIIISKNGGKFVETEFNPRFNFTAFHLAEIADGFIKLALSNLNETSLYMGVYRSPSNSSNAISIPFVLSLKNIVTYVEGLKGFQNNTAYTELHKVHGHVGVYIANVYLLPLYATNFSSSFNIETRITVDHGITWKTFIENEEYRLDCRDGCHLKTNLRVINGREYHRLGQNGEYQTPGLLIRSSFDQGTLISLPYNFGKHLNDLHRLNVGDQGGIIVAIQINTKINSIIYSLDNGENWQSHIFINRGIFTTHILTNATHNTTIFQIFGIDMISDEQVIVTIDFRNVFSRACIERDYKPNKISNTKERVCAAGASQTYNLKLDPTCFNTKPIVYDREPCVCQNIDFQCDWGYFKNEMGADCQLDKTYKPSFDPKFIPQECETERGFFFRSRGYYKNENTQCIGGEVKKYVEQSIACPSKKWDKFILSATENEVNRHNLLDDKSEKLPIVIKEKVHSVDFDLRKTCLFYSDTGVITRICLDGHSELEEIVVKNNSIFRSFAYDGVDEILYYLEQNVNKIFAVHTSEQKLGEIQEINNVDKYMPRYLLVNPKTKTLIMDDVSQTRKGTITINGANGQISILNQKTIFNIRNLAFGLDFQTDVLYYYDFFHNKFAACQSSMYCTMLSTASPGSNGPYKYIFVDESLIYGTFSGVMFVIRKTDAHHIRTIPLPTNLVEVKFIFYKM